VLAAAAVHAGWNGLLAGSRDVQATMAVAAAAGTALLLPFGVATWDLDGSAWPYVVASAALELAYFALLAAAYGRADLSFVYPVARGAAPVLVLVVSVAALGTSPGALAAAGVMAIAAGVVLVRGVGAGAQRGALGLALAVGACIAGYTLVDDEGLNHAAAVPYLTATMVLATPVYVAAVAAARGPAALRVAANARSIAAGAGMVGAYVLTLAALELAPPAPVAALRETSVVMAAGAAALAGREPVARRRLAGAVAVVAGAVMIALG
jgi:drug/metabolite transporter (DMT)-like permease